MNFFIRQGATYPPLKLELIDDGKNDKSFLNDLLENSSVTLNAYDVKTGDPIILGGICRIVPKNKKYHVVADDYYIIYQFNETDTLIKGKYEGEIVIQFRDTDLNPTSKLIVPIHEKLYINII